MNRFFKFCIAAAILMIFPPLVFAGPPAVPPMWKKTAAGGVALVDPGIPLFVGTSGPVVSQADCSTITSGLCINSDDHQIYRWDGDSVENIGGGGTDEIVYQANCATITNGFCIDTDNGYLYYWDGDAVLELYPGSGGTDDQTATEVPNTPAGNIAATNVQAAVNELDSEKSATSHNHSGTYEPADATILKQADVDDTPVNGDATSPVSSSWAYDHEAAVDPHNTAVTAARVGSVSENLDNIDASVEWEDAGALEPDGSLSANTVGTNQYINGSIYNDHVAPGLDSAKVGNGDVSNTELSYIDGQDQRVGRNDSPHFNGGTYTAPLYFDDGSGASPSAQFVDENNETFLIFKAIGGDLDIQINNASDRAVDLTNNGAGKVNLKLDGDIELGHVTDTTLSRASAGDLTVEDNIIYRAGGTDIPNSDIATGLDAVKLADGSVSNEEFQRLDGLSEDLQTTLDNKQPLDSLLTEMAALTPTTDALLGFNGTGILVNVTSIFADVVVPVQESTTAGTLGRTATDMFTMGDNAGAATLYFLPKDDTATNGDTEKSWSADKTFDELALKEPADATILKQADVDDTPVNGVVTDPVSSNWAYDHEVAADPHNLYLLKSQIGTPYDTEAELDALFAAKQATLTGSESLTLTNKTVNYAGTGNSFTMPLVGVEDSILDPVDADDFIWRKLQFATTITDIHCLAEGGGTVTFTLQECTSAGASCADIEGAITCDSDGAEDDGTLTDGSVAAGAWIKVLFGAPSGTVNSLSWKAYGTQVW